MKKDFFSFLFFFALLFFFLPYSPCIYANDPACLIYLLRLSKAFRSPPFAIRPPLVWETTRSLCGAAAYGRRIFLKKKIFKKPTHKEVDNSWLFWLTNRWNVFHAQRFELNQNIEIKARYRSRAGCQLIGWLLVTCPSNLELKNSMNSIQVRAKFVRVKKREKMNNGRNRLFCRAFNDEWHLSHVTRKTSLTSIFRPVSLSCVFLQGFLPPSSGWLHRFGRLNKTACALRVFWYTTLLFPTCAMMNPAEPIHPGLSNFHTRLEKKEKIELGRTFLLTPSWKRE